MGMFSYLCLVCGQDLMSDCSDQATPDWMKEAVVYMPDGVEVSGRYSAYGTIRGRETIRSKYARLSRMDRLSKGESLIATDAYEMLGDDGTDGDHRIRMFRADWLTASCYHRSCWVSAGSPVGYRGPSLRAPNQGFGCREYPEGKSAKPFPEASIQGLWEATAIVHFIYSVHQFGLVMDDVRHWEKLNRMIDNIRSRISEAADEIAKKDRK